MVQNARSYDEFKKIIAAPGKVVFVDFCAKWCGPCKTIAPEFEKFSAKYPDCIFVKVDIDEVDKADEEYKIESLPTFVAIKDGKQIDICSGSNLENLTKFIVKNKG